VEPAVELAASGIPGAVVLECLAERTIVAGLRDRERGYDRRLERRFTPLLPAAAAAGCRVVSNLGAADPEGAARATRRLARRLGLDPKIAAVVGDDVEPSAVEWARHAEGEWLGARAYLGADALEEAVSEGADVIITGRAADAALFAAPVLSPAARFGGPAEPADLALALTVGHLLECAGQVSGGNFEPPGGGGLPAEALARLGYPLATVGDGSAELFVLDGAPARLDALTCTLQLLYEVHDPAAYITPDAILDFTGVRFEEIGANRVRVTGARSTGRPERLKVSGFLERPGAVADVEIAFAGRGALERARSAADVLRARLTALGIAEHAVDLVGVDSVLGTASAPLTAEPPEVRVHASAACEDDELAQAVEDEVLTLTIAGPAAGGAVRSERRAPRLEVVDGLIARELVKTGTVWA
jgi:Acyclic terpene utilisation family protein AtuA